MFDSGVHDKTGNLFVALPQQYFLVKIRWANSFFFFWVISNLHIKTAISADSIMNLIICFFLLFLFAGRS